MRVSIGYPPLPSSKGVPLLSQNRQFQWFKKPTYIYPVVPACAATLAAADGHAVTWLDGIAAGWTPDEFRRQFAAAAPDVALFEAKTPIIRRYWRVIDELKAAHPACRFALCGDHVTALPRESLAQSRVDYVLTGGDYDFLLRDLLRHLAGQGPLPSGVARRDAQGGIEIGERFSLDRDLNELPPIDRDLTQWRLYSTENGNFKYTPGTYIMAGRDCWWGKCRFCAWTTLYPRWRVRTPANVLDEISALVERYGVREIFDDTGCFPAGHWLREFCDGMLARGLHRRVVLGCNMIPGVLTEQQYRHMARAGFRFVLFGLESASQQTLQRIRKCGKAADIENSMRLAHAAGLQPHVTCMLGYPWETRAEARATVALTRSLFDKGYIESLQATIVIPYPGTPLFEECRANDWLLTENWDDYDMRQPVMKTEMNADEILALTRGIYRSFLTPRFVLRKIAGIRSAADIRYLVRAGLRVIGHLLDFR